MAQVIKGGPVLTQAGPGAAPQGMVPKQSLMQMQQQPMQQPMPQPIPVGPAPNIMQPTQILQPPKPHAVPPAGPSQSTSVPMTPSGAEASLTGEDSQAADATNLNMANTKEKTPMCLINELARYNKIQHQYTLTDEQGPAHKKTFYVKLKLGEEEYAASGPSIKKAQHAAAAIALEKTQYKHPPPKPPRSTNGAGQWGPNTDDINQFDDGDNPNITPTVELNALAMKRGEPAVYRSIEQQRPCYHPPPNYDFRGMYNQRYHYPRFPRVFYVSLKVGQREFIGEGNTRQAARHNAAAKALKVLRNLPLPNDDNAKASVIVVAPSGEEGEVIESNVEVEQLAHMGEYDDSDDALKSEISLVHEIALKRNLPVNFEVIRESGPPHMRTFVTRCTVGEFVTDGEGNGKKVSKKRAAEKMLDKLRTLIPLPPSIQRPKRNTVNKKKNRNLIKVSFQLQKADPNYGVGINPISRLIQIQQAKKEKEPIYTLITERGMPRRREFVMQVQVGEHTCTGVGPNKKLAKRNAAEAMLQLLGYSRPSPQPTKPAIKSSDGQVAAADKKVTFIDQDGNTSRQLVPGVLLMPDGARTGGFMNINRGAHYGGNMVGNFSPQTTAAIAKELLDTGASPTAEALVKSGAKPGSEPQKTVRPKQQLLYLAEVLGFQVQYTDFPKGSNKNEYLSLVSLSTNPPQVSHGAGTTIDASHDIAALTALKALADLGLGAVTDIKKEIGAGDGPHMTEANSKDLSNNAIKTEAK